MASLFVCLHELRVLFLPQSGASRPVGPTGPTVRVAGMTRDAERARPDEIPWTALAACRVARNTKSIGDLDISADGSAQFNLARYRRKEGACLFSAAPSKARRPPRFSVNFHSDCRFAVEIQLKEDSFVVDASVRVMQDTTHVLTL